ncbi:MAG: N-acetyltransferase family protein [bacterium]
MSDNDPFERSRKRINVEIRQMEIDDIPEVFHLGEELFTSEDAPTLYRTWDEYEVTGLFHSETELCLVAEANEEIIGFAMGTTITKPRSAWKYGHLVWLGVADDYQRFGVAEKLFNNFLELMLEEGVRILMADTEADNKPALKFFRKMGFDKSEEHVYLSLNLDEQLKAFKQRHTNHNE